LLWIAGDRAGRGARDRGGVAGQPGQQRQRFLIAARLDGGDGFELFDLGGVGLNSRIAARASVKASFAPCWFPSPARRRSPAASRHGS
jgi:hypothetical protein